MIIKKAKYKKVREWRRKEVSPDVYGCDNCKKEIKEYPNESSRLEIAIFHKDSNDTEHNHFCCWSCVLEFIPKIRSKYFATIPYLYFDERKNSKRGAQELIRILTKKNKK